MSSLTPPPDGNGREPPGTARRGKRHRRPRVRGSIPRHRIVGPPAPTGRPAKSRLGARWARAIVHRRCQPIGGCRLFRPQLLQVRGLRYRKGCGPQRRYPGMDRWPGQALPSFPCRDEQYPVPVSHLRRRITTAILVAERALPLRRRVASVSRADFIPRIRDCRDSWQHRRSRARVTNDRNRCRMISAHR